MMGCELFAKYILSLSTEYHQGGSTKRTKPDCGNHKNLVSRLQVPCKCQDLDQLNITRADGKSQVRHCLAFGSWANKDQQSAVQKPKHCIT